ncbi:MAG: hybrid sensor histidine kinase/response regulator [Puniceicoccales bacterium]
MLLHALVDMADTGEEIEGKNAKDRDDTLEQTITLGKLARGIAHDINNLVTSIQGNAQLAARALDNPVELQRSLNNIRLASRHISELTGQIQAYSRTYQLPSSAFDLTRVVREIEQLVRSTLPERMELESKIPKHKIFIHGTASQLSQAVMNLCTNALQATEKQEQGRLSISLSLDGEGHVVLSIEDNGHGIPANKLERIFDPFFTTKEYGIGSGLGLAVVKSVIDAHGATISVESDPWSCTRFKITIPVAEDAEIVDEPKSWDTPTSITQDRNYAVLLVDDEPTIRSLGIDVLHSLGYRVTVACDGREALEIFNRRPDYFDVILSDSRMPEMTGLELAVEVRKVRPELPFILITAFDDTKESPLVERLSITDIVPKPFRIDELQRSLEQATHGTGKPG